jgi:Uma2 family endonuclease
MEKYAHDHYEWVEGRLIEMSPVTEEHDALTGYLFMLLQAYFSFRPIGQTRRDPFVMRMDAINRSREPDIQVILDSNPGKLTRIAMIGPADICIEVVSEESASRDYGNKFVEYEKAGVKEYWLFDHFRKVAAFHRLNDEGIYQPVSVEAQGYSETPLLPGLRLHIPTLWQEKLPGFRAIGDAVKEMLGE